jgi:uncharacterized protein
MNQHEKINYVEFPAQYMTKTKAFFSAAFGWSFTDYGPEYAAFGNQGIEGGFYLSSKKSTTDNGAALVVFYSNELEKTMSRIEMYGGTIVKPIYEFPGGRRFHFTEPSGNEFAVWADNS